MAESEVESILNSWKSPFATPIRKDENACHDIFQNSEKLLASAVSICRLKGSVECQTGGLITVCEELQSLIRLAFSEIRRVEKDFRSQKNHLEGEISCLKERVKYLEEKNDPGPIRNEEENVEETRVIPDCDSREPGHAKANEVNTSRSLPVINDEDSDPYIYNLDGTDITVVSVECASSTKEQVSRTPQENKKSNSKKRLKKLSSKTSTDLSNPINWVDDSNSNDLPSSVTVNDRERQGIKSKPASNAEKSNTATKEPSLDHEHCGLPNNSEANSKKEQQKRKTKSSAHKEIGAVNEELIETSLKSKSLKLRASTRKREIKENRCETEENSVTEMSEAILQEESLVELEENFTHSKVKEKTKKNQRSLQGELPADDANRQKDDPEQKKNLKKIKSVTAEVEPDEFSPEENPGNKIRINTKGRKKMDTLHNEPEENTNKQLSRKKTSKMDSDEMEATNNCEQFEPDNSTRKLKPNLKKTTGGTPSTSDKAAVIENDDEPLGDMSFLIEVNSKISLFASDASQDECELQPMTARERNDVYKVAQLYKLRARIGTKAENNLTTVRLSKQADTKMPKPGRVDRLLSELSIAASKVAFKESPKNQVKRKHSATIVDNNKKTGESDDFDQGGPPRKKLSKQSRANKL